MDSLSFANDFVDVFDNLQDVTLQSREGGDPQTVAAVRRWITSREAEVSNGRYTTDDVTYHLSAVGLNNTPKFGDTVADDEAWTILSVRYERLTERYELICRKLVVASVVTIQKARFAKSEDGIQEATWEDEHTDLPAEIQLLTGTDQVENKLQEVKPVFRVYLSQTIETKNRRVLHNDQLYRIKSHSSSDRIDRLFELTVEEW